MFPERLFFAVRPPAATRDALAALRDRLTTPGARPVATANLHLTLVFLGTLDAARRARALAVGAELTPPPAFDLFLDTLGSWPGPAVRWCAPRVVPVLLEQWVACLRAALTAAGCTLDPRPYRPHVTLLRAAPVLRDTPLQPPLLWPVTRFALLASPPGQRRDYAVLGDWPLGAPRDSAAAVR